jgi:hypothetical protein
MLTGVVNNDPDVAERVKLPVFFRDAQIRTFDRIKDPYANDGKGGFVDIGVVELFDLTTEQPTKFRLVVKGQGVGMFVLDAGSIDDVELYEFLCISNENAKFPYRDKRTVALFEEVAEVDATQHELNNDDLLLESLSVLKKLKHEQKKQLAVLLHIDPTLEPSSLSSNLNQLAKARPNDILENIKELKNSGKKGLGKNVKELELAEH